MRSKVMGHLTEKKEGVKTVSLGDRFLENGACFSKKEAPKQFPYGKIPPPKRQRFPFCKKRRLKMVLSWKNGHCFWIKKGRKWCPFVKVTPFWCSWEKGTVFAARKKEKNWCPLVKGHYISALWALFLYGKDRQNQCLFAKGHQRSAPNGALRAPYRYYLFFLVLSVPPYPKEFHGITYGWLSYNNSWGALYWWAVCSAWSSCWLGHEQSMSLITWAMVILN